MIADGAIENFASELRRASRRRGGKNTRRLACLIAFKKIAVAAREQGTKEPSSTAIKIFDGVERKGLKELR